MNESIRALVIDDHPLVARATAKMLASIETIVQTDIAFSASEGYEKAEQLQPQLAVIDHHLPDEMGCDAAQKLQQQYPAMSIVLITADDLLPHTEAFFRSRADAFLSKGMSVATMISIITCVLDGMFVVPADIFAERFGKIKLPQPETELLTAYEASLMGMIMQGVTQDDISRRLYISKRSIDNHLRKIYDKLGVTNRLQAIDKCIRLGYKHTQTGN